jgi:hypothetical protein
MSLSPLQRVAYMETNDFKTATDEAGKVLKEEVIFQNLFRIAKENQEQFNQSCRSVHKS